MSDRFSHYVNSNVLQDSDNFFVIFIEKMKKLIWCLADFEKKADKMSGHFDYKTLNYYS